MATCGDLFGGDIYEEEQPVELAKYVEALKNGTEAAGEGQPLSKYVENVSKLNAASSHAELLDLFMPELSTIFEKGSEEDVAGAYSILYSLCRKLSEKVQAEYTAKLIKSCTCETGGSTEIRLKMLVNLYNSVHPSFGKMRFTVFGATVDYCVATNQVQKVAKHLGNLEGRVESWKLNFEEKKQIYLKLAEALQSYEKGELSQKLLVTYLSLWKDKLTEAAPQAINASVKAIENPTMFDCAELLRLPAVDALKTGDDKAQAVHRLLEIYSCEKLEDYEKFVKGKSAMLESIGLTNEMCVDKLRMLSLASLAAEDVEITYDRIKEVLKLEKDKDVELWVIKVHRAGLVQGKMDQLRRVVVVNRTTARVFSTTDWESLGQRVDQWRQCLDSMTTIIHGAKEHADLTTQAS